MVNIQSYSHPDSSPSFKYDIVIDGVTITLNRKDFQELTTKLDEKIGQDYKRGLEIYNEIWDGKRREREFLNWLDSVLSETDAKKEPLSAEIVSEIYTKLIDILY